jgi:hypothetical protein
MKHGSNVIRIAPLDRLDAYVFFVHARFPTAEEVKETEKEAEWRESLVSLHAEAAVPGSGNADAPLANASLGMEATEHDRGCRDADDGTQSDRHRV